MGPSTCGPRSPAISGLEAHESGGCFELARGGVGKRRGHGNGGGGRTASGEGLLAGSKSSKSGHGSSKAAAAAEQELEQGQRQEQEQEQGGRLFSAATASLQTKHIFEFDGHEPA